MTAGTDPGNFIRAFIDEDAASGRYGALATRFPPEPDRKSVV